MRNNFLYLLFIPLAAAILPYAASDFLAVPYQHGFFCLEIFMILLVLQSNQRNIVFLSIWLLIFFLFAFFYGNHIEIILSTVHEENISSFYVFGYFSCFLIISNIFPDNKYSRFIIFFLFTIPIIITDWLNLFYYAYSISFNDLWNLARNFVWSTILFIFLPIFHFGLIFLFARRLLPFPRLALKKSYSMIGVLVAILLLNLGINHLQRREVFSSTPLKSYYQKYDKKEANISQDVQLNKEMVNSFAIYTEPHIFFADTTYQSVILILVESWGVPKEKELLEKSFAFFDDIPQKFKGLYLRNVAYTQGAEWEDFGMPQGKVYDFTLPKLYQNAGYETWYLHGYDGDFYERRQNYPSLGFDSLLFRTELFKRGLTSCKYGYPGICDTSSAAFINKLISDSSKKKFIFWTTLDAHYPFKELAKGQESTTCKDFDLKAEACTYYTYEENTLRTIADLAKKNPKTKFIIRGDHRPMGASTPKFISSFYHLWVPMLILN